MNCLKIGFSERDITPDLPGDISAAKRYDQIKVHDRCKARAVAFQEEERSAVVIGVDAESLIESVVVESRRKIVATCGLPREAIMICASHAHNAAFMHNTEPGMFDHASDLIQELAYVQRAIPTREYIAFVVRQIVSAACDALRNRVDAQCVVGEGAVNDVTFNRRFHMKDGKTYTHPGKGNKDILEPAGGIDPSVGALGAWNLNGDFLGCMVNFACHGTTMQGTDLVSADWIYYMEKTIRGALGQDSVVVFLPGASGDITQVDNLNEEKIELGPDAARLVGQSVGGEALKVLGRRARGPLSTLRFSTEHFALKRRRPSKKSIERALALCQEEKRQSKHSDKTSQRGAVADELKEGASSPTPWNYHKGRLLLDALLQKEPEANVEIQALQLGPLLLLANPTEFFHSLGLEIKDNCAFPHTFIVELANGILGYAPTEEAFGENGGGMETELSIYNNLPPEAGRRIVEESLKIAKRFSPEEPPKLEKDTVLTTPQYTNSPELD